MLPLLERYENVTAHLRDARLELAQIVTAEREQKLRGFVESSETSISAREKTAAYMAFDCTRDAIQLQAQIAVLEDERDYLKVALDAET